MTPISELTRAELEDRIITDPHPSHSAECLAELLRRERERCAAELHAKYRDDLALLVEATKQAAYGRCADVCRDWAADMRKTWAIESNKWAHQEAAGAEECEFRIRELQ